MSSLNNQRGAHEGIRNDQRNAKGNYDDVNCDEQNDVNKIFVTDSVDTDQRISIDSTTNILTDIKSSFSSLCNVIMMETSSKNTDTSDDQNIASSREIDNSSSRGFSSTSVSTAHTSERKSFHELDNERVTSNFLIIFHQLNALIKKNNLKRLRTPLTTIVELILPVLFMLILVIAHDMTGTVTEEAAIYANPIVLNYPADYDTVLSLSVDLSTPNLDLQEEVSTSKGIENQTSKEFSWYDIGTSITSTIFETLSNKEKLSLTPTPMPSPMPTPIPIQSSAPTQEKKSFLDSLDNVEEKLSSFLSGPIPIPSIGQYVTLSNILQSNIPTNEIDNIYKNADYFRKWGNLLTGGTIHICPSGPIADEFVSYIKEKHGIINELDPIQVENTDNEQKQNNDTYNEGDVDIFDSSLLETDQVNIDSVLDGQLGASALNFTKQASDGDLFDTLLNDLYGDMIGDIYESNAFLSYITDEKLKKVQIRVHKTSADAMSYIMSNINERTFVLVDFEKTGLLGNNFNYTLRMNYTTLPNTNQIVDWAEPGFSRTYQRYILSGHLTMQRTINEFAILQRMANASRDADDNIKPNTTVFEDSVEILSSILDETDEGSNICTMIDSLDVQDVFTMPLPTKASKRNTFFQAVGFILGLCISMAFMYPVSRTIKLIVEEKESRMKETLLILGTNEAVYWWSWIITAVIVFTIISTPVAYVLSRYIMRASSPFYIFIFIYLFSSSIIGFSTLVASFFSKARLASILGPALLFVTLLPRYIFFDTNRYESTHLKMVASLFPCTAFAFGVDAISEYEYSSVGVNSGNVNEGDFSFNTSLSFLFVDTLIYSILGWYVDQVVPRQFGAPKVWYFPFTANYWKNLCKRTFSSNHETDVMHYNETINKNLMQNQSDTIEANPSMPTVLIKNLVKKYDKMIYPAVNNLTLAMGESEIICLLGHNGAGKSSTISILTGLYPPSSGDCFIYGKSIVNDIANARKSMGVCPQQNVIFDDLTVFEHFVFFERMRGVRRDCFTFSFTRKDSIIARANEIGLIDHLYTRAGNLSGGNKRKLCLAIALIGEPKFLLLDEPTSGMDPASRRVIWELLRNKRKGRTILLTTHFMDEAEILSDRIAILGQGELKCFGQLAFLRTRFGLGYKLTSVTSAKPKEDLRENQITTFLEKFVPETKVVHHSGHKLVHRFPLGSERCFPELFKDFEESLDNLGVEGYGISNSSLEDIFFEVDMSNKFDTATETQSEGRKTVFHQQNLLKSHISRHQMLNFSGFLSQVFLLLQKRMLIQRRDIKGFFFTIILPVLLISLVLAILLIDISPSGSNIELSVDLISKATSNYSKLHKKHNILVGGSATNHSVSSFATIMEESYSNEASFTFLNTMNSSRKISEYIQGATDNLRSQEVRFGSYVIGDLVNLTMKVSDWDAVKNKILEEVQENDVLASLLINETITTAFNGLAMEDQEKLIIFAYDIITGNFNEDLELPLLMDTNLSTISDFLVENDSALFNNTTSFDEIYIDELLSKYGQVEVKNNNAIFDVYLKPKFSIMHNSSSPHGIAAFTQSLFNQIYRSCGSDSHGILSAKNHPLPLTTQQAIEVKLILSVLAILFLLLPYCYIPAAFTNFVVKERVSKSKHLQLVSGISMVSYWISNFIWDLLLYMILSILIMLVFLAYGRDSASFFVADSRSFWCVFCLTFGYGVSALPFAYLFSRFFDKPSNTQISIVLIFFITGFVAFNSFIIMDTLENTKDIARKLRPLFRLWPAFNVGEGFLQVVYTYWRNQTRENRDRNPFEWKICGQSLFRLYILSIPYFLLLLLLECSNDGGSGGFFGMYLRRIRVLIERSILKLHDKEDTVKGDGDSIADLEENTSSPEDLDVMNEREKIYQNREAMKKSSPVLLFNLRKIYPRSSLLVSCFRRIICFFSRKENVSFGPKRALKGVSLSISQGETFGLLGINGAGKTTTMSILTGDIMPTSGEIYVAGFDMTGNTTNEVNLARKSIGFCPQIDPLLDLMTGRETLRLFGRLRGIHHDILDDIVNDLMESLTLKPHADKYSETYSGGNKRKLSLGIALIGSPKVLFIDEASSGMDPIARRAIWDVIGEAAKDKAIIITTHSMEEAEALCSRVGVMINGELKCLGGVQHLKAKLSGGYIININLKAEASKELIEIFKCHVVEVLFVGSIVQESFGRFIKIEVPIPSNYGVGVDSCVSAIFRTLQTVKDDDNWCIDNYSVSQCSLEHVFMSLVKLSDN